MLNTIKNESEMKKVNVRKSIKNEYKIGNKHCNLAWPLTTSRLENELWIADTGSSCHTTGSKSGLFNFKKPSEDHYLSGGDGGRVSKTDMFDDFKGIFIDQYGNRREILLRDVGYVDGREVNLLSLTK